MNLNFSTDLKVGGIMEVYVQNLLLKFKPDYTVIPCTNNKHDFILTNGSKEICFEVKHDMGVPMTGNIAVEFTCRGKDSGYRTTKSDYYVYGFYKGILATKTTVLKTYIENNWDKLDVRYGGGDEGSDTGNILFPLHKFESLGGKYLEKYSDIDVYFKKHIQHLEIDESKPTNYKYVYHIINLVREHRG